MDSIPTIILKDSVKVGELTPIYLQFLKSIKDANLYKNINPFKRQILLLQKDLISYTDLLAKYKKQESINKEQLTLVETDYNRDKSLYESKTISAREYDNKKKEYLNALNSNEQVKITVSNALIQINSIEKNILQLQIQDYQEQAKLKNDLSQNLKTLSSEINKWKQLYLIQSPTNGKISFFSVWTENQNIKLGDELFAVIPTQKQEFVGKCILPITNTGKLQTGQKVNIKLDNYQYNEMGMLQGIVTNISEVPNKDTYAIDVKLNNGLVTSYNKTLSYREEMKGKADIITKNISVMDRIFFNFKKLVDRK
jgi:multidrug resistance efflux pump